MDVSADDVLRLLDRLPDCVFRVRVRPTLAVEFVTRAIEALSGRPPQAFRDKPRLFLDVLHPDDRPALSALIAGDQQDAVTTLRLVAPDSSIRWVEAHVHLVRGEAGRTLAVEGSLRDVHERTLLHDDLVRAEAQYRALVEASPDMIGRYDRDHRHLFVNGAVLRTTGLSFEAIVGKAPHELGDPAESYHLWYAAADEAFATGTPVTVEFPYHDRWGESIVVPEPDIDGTIPTVVYVSRDVTDRVVARRELAGREAMLRRLLDEAPFVIALLTPDGAMLRANGRWEDLTGQPVAEAIGEGYLARVHPDDVLRLLDVQADATAHAKPFDLLVRLVHLDGSVRRVQVSAAPVLDERGEIGSFSSVMIDRTLELDARERADELAAVMDAAGDHVVITRPDGRAVFVNEAARNAMAAAGVDAWEDLLEAGSRARFRDEAIHEAGEIGVWQGELLVRSAGADVPVSVAVQVRFDARGEPASIGIVARDIRELDSVRRHLAHLATHDPLTGLGNRADLLSHLEIALEHSPLGTAVLFADLDRFKAVNDRYGHQVGDAVLRVVAERLASSVRLGDVVGRLGGDEFVVIPRNPVTEGVAQHLLERLKAALDTDVEVGDIRVRVGISVGVAVAEPGDTADRLLNRADLAMYRAKNDR